MTGVGAFGYLSLSLIVIPGWSPVLQHVVKVELRAALFYGCRGTGRVVETGDKNGPKKCGADKNNRCCTSS